MQHQLQDQLYGLRACLKEARHLRPFLLAVLVVVIGFLYKLKTTDVHPMLFVAPSVAFGCFIAILGKPTRPPKR